jgi:uncharacterized protein (TIGR02172 family)
MNKGRLLGKGRTAEIYAWGDGQILKLFHDFVPEGWIQHEAHVGRIVMEAGLNAPNIGSLIKVDGRRGLLYERVNGPTMLSILTKQPWRLFELARHFAAIHAQVHQSSGAQLPSQRVQLRRTIERLPQLSEAVKARIFRRLENLPDGKTLCHGDYHPDNILMAARGPVVIDWTTANCGNPVADVARTALLFLGGSLPPGMETTQRFMTESLRHLFYRLYLREYRRYRPVSDIEIQIWLPILAAARLAEEITEEEAHLLARVQAAFG